jgi:DNA-binding HxlR family transcriptional regulator
MTSGMVEEDMLKRVPYQQHPVRHEYRLTDKGRDFFTVLAAMIRWGDRWLSDPSGPPSSSTTATRASRSTSK